MVTVGKGAMDLNNCWFADNHILGLRRVRIAARPFAELELDMNIFFVDSLIAGTNNIQNFRCKAPYPAANED